jgi:Cu(I)/Ag(I) efflux system membrane fusion protein
MKRRAFIHTVSWASLTVVWEACTSKNGEQVPDNVFYTCSMDPQVMEKKPGTCPICKMALTKIVVDPNMKNAGLKLSDQQKQLANIQIETVALRPLGEEVTLAAILTENKDKLATVTARVAGRIERLLVRNVGEFVRVGQPIYEVYSEELSAAQQDYLIAVQKQKVLKDADVNFKQLTEAAKNKLLLWGMNEGQIAELEKEGHPQNKLTVFSRYAGAVTEVLADEGTYVSEGTTVLKLADLSTLWAEGQLYVTELSFLNQTQEALVEMPYFPGRILKGKVNFVNPEVQTSSKILTIRVDVANGKKEYKPGMQAYITLKGTVKNTIAVPTNALIQDTNGVTVWLENAEGAFESRMVSVGMTNKDYTEITDGLKAGEKVVISGAYLLNSEYIFKKGSNPMEGHKM